RYAAERFILGIAYSVGRFLKIPGGKFYFGQRILRRSDHFFHPRKFIIPRVAGIKGISVDVLTVFKHVYKGKEQRTVHSATDVKSHRHIGPETQENAFF